MWLAGWRVLPQTSGNRLRDVAQERDLSRECFVSVRFHDPA